VRLAFSVTRAKASDGAGDGTVERFVDVIASTASKDRDGEIVQQDWLLDGVTSVPVFWEHNYSLGWGLDPYDPRASLPIGKATDLRVEEGALKARLTFVDEKANPLGPMVFEGFKQGSIRSVSVGFVPHDVRAEVHEGEEVLVLSANELLEISACSIGRNRDAGVVEAKTFAALRARAQRGGGQTMKTVRKQTSTGTSAAFADEQARVARYRSRHDVAGMSRAEILAAEALDVTPKALREVQAGNIARRSDAPLLPEELQVLKQVGMSADEYRKAIERERDADAFRQTLTPEERAVLRQTGVSEDEYRKVKAKGRAA
jgi:HK97 family phage prohead protease